MHREHHCPMVKEGLVKKVHYIANIEKQDFVPDFVTAPG